MMTKERAIEIRNAINEALTTVNTKLGIKASAGSCRISNDGLRVSVDVVEPVNGVFVSPEEKQNQAEAMNLKIMAAHLSLPIDTYGTTFVDRGRTYTVVGLTVNYRKKRPFALQRDDGKRFYGSIEHVVAMLNARK